MQSPLTPRPGRRNHCPYRHRRRRAAVRWREDRMAKAAFLGLGVMGYPMAGHLKNKGGHDLTVYNRTAAKAEEWVGKHGGRRAPAPQAAGGGPGVRAGLGRER